MRCGLIDFLNTFMVICVNLLKFPAKLGAFYILHHTISMSVKFWDELPETIHCLFPSGQMLVSLGHSASMAA